MDLTAKTHKLMGLGSFYSSKLDAGCRRLATEIQRRSEGFFCDDSAKNPRTSDKCSRVRPFSVEGIVSVLRERIRATLPEVTAKQINELLKVLVTTDVGAVHAVGCRPEQA